MSAPVAEKNSKNAISKTVYPTIPKTYIRRLPDVIQSGLGHGDDQRSLATTTSIGSWTRNSVLTEFSGVGAPVARAMRGLGRLIVDPIDNFIGRRELVRFREFLARLSCEEWVRLDEMIDVEAYGLRVVECIR